MAISTQPTVLDALLASLAKAADHNRDDAVGPAAVLWPDEKREWERLVPRIRVLLPHGLVSDTRQAGTPDLRPAARLGTFAPV